MLSLVSRSRCLRVSQTSALRYHGRARVRTLCTFKALSDNTRCFGSHASGLESSSKSASCRPSPLRLKCHSSPSMRSRLRLRTFHSSARVGFPPPKHQPIPRSQRKGVTSTQARPKLASPADVAKPKFKPNSNSKSKSKRNFDPRPQSSYEASIERAPWLSRGQRNKSRTQARTSTPNGIDHSKTFPNAETYSKPQPFKLRKKLPNMRKRNLLLGQSFASVVADSDNPGNLENAVLTPEDIAHLSATLGILPRSPTFPDGAQRPGTVKQRKKEERTLKRIARQHKKLRADMKDVEREEIRMRRMGLSGPVNMSRPLWRTVKHMRKLRRLKEEGTGNKNENEEDGGGETGKQPPLWVDLESVWKEEEVAHGAREGKKYPPKPRMTASSSSSSSSAPSFSSSDSTFRIEFSRPKGDRRHFSSSSSSPSSAFSTLPSVTRPSLLSSALNPPFPLHLQPGPSLMYTRSFSTTRASLSLPHSNSDRSEDKNPPTALHFSNRKARQQSWRASVEKSWSTVGLPSSSPSPSSRRLDNRTGPTPPFSSSNNRNKKSDIRPLAPLSAVSPKNSRARFSPSAWASATRFSAPLKKVSGNLGAGKKVMPARAGAGSSTGRLGMGGAAGMTSRYRRSLDIDRATRGRIRPPVVEEWGVFQDGDEGEQQQQQQYPAQDEKYGFSRRKDPKVSAENPRSPEADSYGAADFSRKGMSPAKARAVERAVREAAQTTFEDEEEFYKPPKPVTSISSSSLDPQHPPITPPSRTSTSRGSSSPSPSLSPSSSAHLDPEGSSETTHRFSSPPLLPGFVSALREMFGERVRPTPIQGLSVRWVLEGFGRRFLGRAQDAGSGESAEEKVGGDVASVSVDAEVDGETKATTSAEPEAGSVYRQFLLAAETGSGKSIAYLLPLLQNLKLTESAFRARMSMSLSTPSPSTPPPTFEDSSDLDIPPHLYRPKKQYEHAPRALILAPTHELARQLAVFAKNLLHYPDTRLRVVCASLENTVNTSRELKKENRREQMRRRARLMGMGGDRSSKDAEGISKKEMFEGVVFDNELPSASPAGREGGVSDVPESVEEGQGRRLPVDVFVGTPLKLLEMVWGRGRDRLLQRASEASRVYTAASASSDAEYSRKAPLEFGKWRTKGELGLENVEYVVVDEADVLFDKDFEETTRLLLADIAAARGQPVPYPLNPAADPSVNSPLIYDHKTNLPLPADGRSIAYPFNLILTSATIPNSLNTYLTHVHPDMLRLASPRLHKLPKGLGTEYVDWSGGNKWSDVLYRLKRVWSEDMMEWRANQARERMGERGVNSLLSGRAADPRRFLEEEEERRKAQEEEEMEAEKDLSKIVIFCNASKRVDALSQYLEENGVPNVAVTSGSENRRQRSSNSYLSAFLKDPKSGRKSGSRLPKHWAGRASQQYAESDASANSFSSTSGQPKSQPRVLITTSLLSRGLDFSPAVKHVFVLDQPRNMIDFLHRAGRVGRAGQKGTVVVFGKMSGRGSRGFKDVMEQMKKVGGRRSSA